MTPHSIIQQHIVSIRERQGKATQGAWSTGGTFHGSGTRNVWGPISKGRQSGKMIAQVVPSADAEYIAAACSPKNGDLTNLLSAVEVMAEALRYGSEMLSNGFSEERIETAKVILNNGLRKAAVSLAGKEGV